MPAPRNTSVGIPYTAWQSRWAGNKSIKHWRTCYPERSFWKTLYRTVFQNSRITWVWLPVLALAWEYDVSYMVRCMWYSVNAHKDPRQWMGPVSYRGMFGEDMDTYWNYWSTSQAGQGPYDRNAGADDEDEE
eukprot:NODE_2594_length_539_cov_66.174757_g2544_i0.p2 GENE.NODE_2594_length_539_cov_66.174757_g2544_i0~~NODE_2594_length_539_cov_66.174757_g2544_i0.p2  ORF type:complete len:132 (+),score=17.50 NODE_2594_length_539_cov_66.174757_g2544_i0:77-472(+)